MYIILHYKPKVRFNQNFSTSRYNKYLKKNHSNDQKILTLTKKLISIQYDFIDFFMVNLYSDFIILESIQNSH